MGNALGTKKTLREQLRENKREINRAVRQLDRERTNLQLQEKKLILEIKKMAKEGQIASVKIMAKDLVRTRQHVTKFYTMRSQLQAVSLRLDTAQSAEAMTSALQGTTTAMKAMASTMNLPRLNRIMMEYTKESEKMEMTHETVGDTIDDVMDAEQDEEEEEKIVGQVLDEIGIDMTGAVPEAPTAHMAPVAAVVEKAAATAVQLPAAPVAAGDGESTDSALSDLEKRLNNLRRS
uniref:Charged multivesicular body protein 2a n=1 Tax=Peronospora matthiolae TaxID=2874970 RepID=A0AAV1TG19_9STRA